VDSNQHVNQLWYDAGGWHGADLTAAVSGPNASLTTGFTSWLQSDGPHVIYVDSNQHVNQLWYDASGWHGADLTASVVGPKASLATGFTSWMELDGPHVVYVAANQHVHQLWYDSSGWHSQDLTSMVNGPLAAVPGAGTPIQPTVNLTNVTHPNLTPNFAVGDTFQITIHGAPNQPVNLTQTANGSTGTSYMGNTDAYGIFTMTGVEQTGNIGSYTQVWSVGGVQAGSAISFMVGQLGGGTASITDLGATADGHISGVSILSIRNGSATTYSATELDYAASLYYDAGTSATLYEEGAAIRSGSASGSGLADGYMSAPATAWKDYDIQTNHYVIAYIPYGPYFVNQFYYQDGSCAGYSSDCTFGPGGGVYYVAVASIYLGSTLAHQTNVPQDGSVPLVDDSAYDSFLSTVSPPPDSGVTFSVDAWGKIIRDVAPILFIARSVWADQHPESPYIYPLPYLIDLIDDTQSKPVHTGDNAKRIRTYLLLDTYGNPMPNSSGVRVSETFHYVGGTGPMPAPNNPATPDSVLWTYSSGEMVDGNFSDEYGFQASSQPPVWYWQFYWASGFTVPSDFTLFPIPGITGDLCLALAAP
jgi:hypothetical protein